jgi:hypothetical protein
MCIAATGRLQGRAAKLLLARRKSWYNENLGQICLAANGPAIWGGCVTRRSIRVESWYFSQKAVTVRGEYGAVFAVQVQTLWPIRVSRYNVDREQVTSQGIQSFNAGTGAIAV